MALVLLEQRTEKDYNGADIPVTDYLCIETGHNDGKYRLSVNKETHKGMFKEFLPFANGNFSVRIGLGRKSAKKLDKLNNIIENTKEQITELWKQGKYNDIVSLVLNKCSEDKVF